MSKQDLLLEIGLEELPARFVTDAMNQLSDKVSAWLEEKRITCGQVTAYSTPRRLAVIVKDVNEAQEDISEEARGPAKKIAMDEQGNWTKAAQGFAKGQGASVDDIFFKEVKGVEYAFVNKFSQGQPTLTLLPELKDVITSLNFPKNMRWGTNQLRYARPIKWLVCLFGQEIVPFQITNVKTSNHTEGHRFLGKQVTIANAGEYVDKLQEQYVIADAQERKEMISKQLEQLANKQGWIIPIDEELLEEVNNLVEYPTALFGSFDELFLNLPEEVLITSMKEHQRYFPVKNADGELLAFFVTVRNGDERSLELVAKGNEKVLRARLADAQFFYEEDQKQPIEASCNRLDNIVFHEELGTIGDKVRRIRELSGQISTLAAVNTQTKQHADRAAQICKFDLVTNMVNEFTELQGLMGERYARVFGEAEAVAVAINEHYMPRSASDDVPATEAGAVVSIADKLDTIVGCFGIGLIPSGSQDPYALRRQAGGIMQILIAKEWSIRFETLLEVAVEEMKNLQLLKRQGNDVMEELVQFFKMRLKNILQEKGIRYDVIEAVLAGPILKPYLLVRRAELLQEKLADSAFKETVEALSRVTNISKKATAVKYDANLFEEAAEKNLYEKYVEVEKAITESIDNGEIAEAYHQLETLKEPIDQYFEHTMVMAEDEKMRENRLGFMASIAQTIKAFAHFNEIVFK